VRAYVLEQFDQPPTLQDLPEPTPAQGQVRIRVKAAGLNKMDTVIASGMVKGMAEYQFIMVED
jgi:NADPH:quinone reductase